MNNPALWMKPLIDQPLIGALTLLQPIVTMGFGYLLLDELLSGLQLAGAAVTLAAMWLFYQARQRT